MVSCLAALALNLLAGAQIYYSPSRLRKKTCVPEYPPVPTVLEKVRQDYVDGEKLTYRSSFTAPSRDA